MELTQYIMPEGVERVIRGVPADDAISALLERLGYDRPFVVTSRTLNRTIDLVERVNRALGGKVVGSTDDIGEHAPIEKILAAAKSVAEAKADVLLAFGGGSVLDFSKFVQLAISESAFTRDELVKFAVRMSEDGTETICTSTAAPAVRQIAIPTTLSGAEWTSSGTPLDEATGQKVRLRAVRGAPQAIVYDPEMLIHTPHKLLYATAVRGLDHAINSYITIRPHALVDAISLEAVSLYFANLPRLVEDPRSLDALAACQLATWYVGMSNVTMSPVHGFSHWMVHILAPRIGAGHSETGGVLMLAQMRWLEEVSPPRLSNLSRAAGQDGEKMSELLRRLLGTLGLPTTLGELGATPEQVEEAVPLALRHPNLTKFNVRPLESEDDIRRILALAW